MPDREEIGRGDEEVAGRPAGEALREEDADSDRLVARAQGGDDDAFSTLYTRYFNRIFAYLRVVLNNEEEAEDGAQQVFLNAFEALPRYEQRGVPFRVWLFAVARNYALTELQRLGRIEPMDPVELDRMREGADPSQEPQLSVVDWITDHELFLFFERLPLPQRQVLTMRYTLGLTNPQIGEILGRTANDVSTLHRRAIAFLRKRLTAIGRGPERPDGNNRMRAWNPQNPVLRNRRFSL